MTKILWYRRRKYDQITVPLVSVAVVILLTVLVLIPQVGIIIEEVKSLNLKREALSQISEKATLLSNLDIAELTTRSNTLAGVLPSSEDFGYFVVSMRTMSQRAGVAFLGVDFGGDVKDDPTDKGSVEFTAVVSGSLTALRGFVLEVERSAPLVELKSLEASRQLDSGLYQARISLKFYYEEAPDDLGDVGQPLKLITAANERTYERLLDLVQPEVVVLPRVATGNQDLML